jgi:hypothetical protein
VSNCNEKKNVNGSELRKVGRNPYVRSQVEPPPTPVGFCGEVGSEFRVFVESDVVYDERPLLARRVNIDRAREVRLCIICIPVDDVNLRKHTLVIVKDTRMGWLFNGSGSSSRSASSSFSFSSSA